MYVFSAEKVLDSCSFRDEEDDCTYHYTVENPKDPTVKDLEVQVLKKKGELQVGYVSHMLCGFISATDHLLKHFQRCFVLKVDTIWDI